MEPIRNNSCCPTFLIAIAGPWICILGAVFVEQVVIEELTGFIWIGGHAYKDGELKWVTRMLAALGDGIGELKEYYSEVGALKTKEDMQRFFPFVRSYRIGDKVVRFSYEAYLVPKIAESQSKAIFLARESDGESDGHIVVKFVQTYHAEAHRLLAGEGRAPKLLYCSSEDDRFEGLTGLTMIVMEHVKGEMAHELYGNGAVPGDVLKEVEKAVGILHTKNIVFGDLRQPNIMIADGRVMLIDFDWCGVHGEGMYPVSLNDSGDIDWHPEVKRGGVMMKEHDSYRLRMMGRIM